MKVELELENAVDRELFSRGAVREHQIRSAKIHALADSGAIVSVLPPNLVEALGLEKGPGGEEGQ